MKILIFFQIFCFLYFLNNAQGEDSDNILTNEGKPGWIEKLLKEAEKEQDEQHLGRQQSDESTLGDVYEDGNPPLVMTKLDDAFNKLGTDATGAKSGLSGLRSKWGSLPFAERNGLMATMNVAAAQIGAIANAGDDPVGAVRGVINMVGALSVAAGPTGMIVNVAMNFVSGLLSLFGIGGKKKQKTVGEIVREQIDEALDKYADRSLMEEAEGIMEMFDNSKAYVDSLVKHNRQLTVNEANMVAVSVPLWQGLKFMGKLSGIILNLIQKNEVKSSRKLLKYIEVYTNVAILKDMILMETAMLMPDELKIHGAAMLVVQNKMRIKQKNWFKFLFEADISKKAIHYYDPDKYPVTDSYLTTMLKVSNYDRSLAGTWCITPHIYGKALTPLGWSRVGENMGNKPYVTTENAGCFYKLIPHGNHLYTIQNNFKCPSYRYCGQYMSFDIVNGKARATIEDDDPTLWEIYGHQQKR